MKKRNLLVLALALMVLPSMAYAQRDVKLTVNGKPVVSKPAAFIASDRTMVPVRFVAEALDYQVLWNEGSRDILLTKMNFDTNKPEQALVLKTDAPRALVIEKKDVSAFYEATTKDTFTMTDVDGYLNRAKVVNLELKPIIKEDRTFIPLRAVVELFDQNISWDDATSTVSIVGDVAKTDDEIAGAWLYNKLPAEYKKPPFKLIKSLSPKRNGLAEKHIYAYDLIEDYPDHIVTIDRYHLDLNESVIYKYDVSKDGWVRDPELNK
ncbi:copper amine oxidase N-terminal domain-containing protein [Aedoeadaptatus coli]|uniref:copper amine oxidase N-terminal domain-containing protein n=1 Tax=Aedoeadaptatus coli TaxID=2058292 RepID=UPI000D555C17|nr:copper amine oxidase N-terminal domain-containing protein [Peptoniphilus coli]